MSDLFLKARNFASKAHEGQKYGNDNYYVHLCEVYDVLLETYGNQDDELAILCFLHDVLEDTDVTYETLVKEFGRTMADYVYYISHSPEDSRESYLAQTKLYPKAHKVKICDTIANLKRSISGCKFKKIEKYSKQLGFLLEGVNHD